MLTKEKVLEAVKNGKKTNCIDGRDYSRLCEFYPVSEWQHFGFGLKDGAKKPKAKSWTEENIRKQLASDVAFGFEKALNQRGISSGLMYEVVKMWLWILEDELQNDNEYAQYDLPLFKKVATKYGFRNEIGDDRGSEHKYSG